MKSSAKRDVKVSSKEGWIKYGPHEGEWWVDDEGRLMIDGNAVPHGSRVKFDVKLRNGKVYRSCHLTVERETSERWPGSNSYASTDDLIADSATRRFTVSEHSCIRWSAKSRQKAHSRSKMAGKHAKRQEKVDLYYRPFQPGRKAG